MLPLDLIIIILDFLDEPPLLLSADEWEHETPNLHKWERSFPSLASCSLVCRTWNDLCRPRIFRTINIWREMDDEDRPFPQFEFLHFTAPHLCKFAIELRIGLDEYLGDSVPAWMHACLSRFENIRELELCGEAWSEIALPITEAIVSLLSSISLKRLVLLGWNEVDTLPILSACSRTIEDLSIDTLPSKKSVDLSVIPLQALRKLELSMCSRPFREMSTIVCPNLNAFTLNLQDDTFKLPSWLPASVSELSIRAESSTHLPQIERPLHRLTLQLDLTDSDTSWLSEYISHLPFLDKLRELIIKIGVYGEKNFLSLPAAVRYKTLCHLLRPIQHPKLAIQMKLFVWTRTAKNRGVDELDRIRLREIARMEEAYAPLLQAGSFSGQLLIVQGNEDEGRVVRHCEVRSADWKATP